MLHVETLRDRAHPIDSLILIRMRSPKGKWCLLTLAVLINFGGGPMTWAHLGAQTPGSQTIPEQCPEHRDTTQDDNGQAPGGHGSLPCCGGGACVCGCPSSPPLLISILPGRFEYTVPRNEARFAEPTSTLLDDALRPPIA
ncbi:MAG: hypothetical protein ACT4O5_08870 [Gammaproteobacteria bacterium]